MHVGITFQGNSSCNYFSLGQTVLNWPTIWETLSSLELHPRASLKSLHVATLHICYWYLIFCLALIWYLWYVWNKHDTWFETPLCWSSSLRLPLIRWIASSCFLRSRCPGFSRQLYPKHMFLESLVCLGRGRCSIWFKYLRFPGTSSLSLTRWICFQLFPCYFFLGGGGGGLKSAALSKTQICVF